MQKKSLFLLCILCLIAILGGLSSNNKITAVKADAEYDLVALAEKYTESDKLVLDDGSLSNKTIQDFVLETKNSGMDAYCPEITQVIPRQFMESTDYSATYQYNGKEYGFYVVKEGQYFDVLLIDFVYDFENEQESDLEYIIKINPILQKSFVRSQNSDGEYRWRKYDTVDDELRYTYYVANPRFLTYIQNENALNYGDRGYSMESDDGLIILQSRANYGKISYATEEDLLGTVVEISGKKALDGGIKLLDTVCGGIAGYVKDAIEISTTIIEKSFEQTIVTNNESNIFTRQSKIGQLQNDYPCYSRSAAFVPNNEIVLSADVESYAEFITVLSDANYRTRVSEVCDFDIVRRTWHYGSMEYVSKPADGKDFSFHKQFVVFDDQPPVFEFSPDNFEDVKIPLYILPSGKQRITFSPLYSGIYNFSAIGNAEVRIYADDGSLLSDNCESVRLRGGQRYYIAVVNISNNTIYGQYLGCTIKEYGDVESFTLYGSEKYVIRYDSRFEKMYKVQVNNGNCSVRILDESFNVIKYPANGGNKIYYDFKQNTYYFLIINNSSSTLELSCALEELDLYELDQEYQITLNNEEIFVRFEVPATAPYYLEYSLGENLSYKGCTVVVFQETSDVEIRKNWTFVNLNASQQVCFGFVGAGTVTFKFERDTNDYQWEIDGVTYPTTRINDYAEFVASNEIVARRGTQLSVKLKAGNVYLNKFEKANDYNGYTFANGILTINADCQLTNLTKSNIIGLNAVYLDSDRGAEIAKLKICVISDISTVSFEVYSNDSSYGITYGAISSVEGETVELTFQVVSPIAFTAKTIVLNRKGGTYDLKNYVESEIAHTDVSVLRIVIKEIKIISVGGTAIIYAPANGEVYQQIKNIRDIHCSRSFESGNGTSYYPFFITCLRHLKNIRISESISDGLNTNSDTTDDRVFYYKLDSNIVINETSSADNYVICETFWGVLNLNYNTIYLNNTNIDGSKDYGFVITNNGTIKYGSFAPYFQTTSTTDGSSTKNIGVVCAVNSEKGLILGITINHTTGRNPDIYVRGWNSRFGTIAGSNYGKLRNCTNNAIIRGNCKEFAGIVGWAGEYNNEVNYCSNYGDIYGEAVGTSSACFGGIVSVVGSEKSIISSPSNYGALLFDRINSTYKVTVCIGQIAGKMCKDDDLANPYCGGSAKIKDGVPVYEYYLTDAAVGMYYESSKPSEGGSCVAEGTMITLADGRQVPVESLTGSERLLVWNLKTGSFDSAPILFIDHDALANYKIINLRFSDGTVVKVIDEHAFWDFDLNKYVFLRKDAAQYIGHWFNKQTTDEGGNLTWTRVQLTNVTLTEEYTTAWSPVTYGHLCIYVNGMLSMPGATEGFVNIFDVDGETMKIDEAQYLADVATYGLFTYEEFAEIYDVPEAIFEAVGGENLKVSIGKGFIDYETLGVLIERYSEFFE